METDDYNPSNLENKRNALEVFNFYCNKYLDQRGDFDSLNNNKKLLGLNGFVGFCKDFKIPATGV